MLVGASADVVVAVGALAGGMCWVAAESLAIVTELLFSIDNNENDSVASGDHVLVAGEDGNLSFLCTTPSKPPRQFGVPIRENGSCSEIIGDGITDALSGRCSDDVVRHGSSRGDVAAL